MTDTPTDRALILDFGGVISRTLFETHDLTERALGLGPGTLTWFGPFHPESDGLWQAMQAGRISERDYWTERTREVGALVGEHWSEMQQFVRAARGADPDAVIRPEFRETLAICKAAGIRLAILSNELDLFYGADFREKLPFLADFEIIVDATHTGILKPDPRAYSAVLDALALPAANCVFVDDQKRNIAGAREIGLQTVHFDVARPGPSYAEALRLLGLQ
ncbi:HAD-IA family hydrolase [Aquicoccus porphyridii]|uniref:HAD-IA family hydrolase n=1 Tax=Aquicoccus porphyridii TaxID=1852029 RepID=A0A5A9Z624_9RHOB|nr:HAD-IA family hydrolase [Aquicoccus porphyridii]KAA0912617.1 HAD-IA family hydrolase [Aquicoccus porphyridii]RAI55428.1 HAD family phosphatase [Rhodobacteraceae bacterium AsT-22]